MKKRDFLRSACALAASGLWPWALLAQSAVGAGTTSTSTVLAAWHQDGSAAQDAADYVGLFELDWQAGQVRIQSSLAVPTRTHGLLTQPDGGFVAVAVRPGAWMVRCDARGQPVQWLHMDKEPEGRTLDGHACFSAGCTPPRPVPAPGRAGSRCGTARPCASRRSGAPMAWSHTSCCWMDWET